MPEEDCNKQKVDEYKKTISQIAKRSLYLLHNVKPKPEISAVLGAPKKGEDENYESLNDTWAIDTWPIDTWVGYKYKQKQKWDADDSKGDNPYISWVYQTLWGYQRNKFIHKVQPVGFAYFGKSSCFGNVLWGGETIHSLIHGIKDDVCPHFDKLADKEKLLKSVGYDKACATAGSIGNYVLVPAGFNKGCISGGKDKWSERMEALRIAGWNMLAVCSQQGETYWDIVAKTKTGEYASGFEAGKRNIYGDFDESLDYIRYVNVMYLWDTLNIKKADLFSYRDDMTQAVEKRSLFMAAMLLIAELNSKENTTSLEYTYPKNWEEPKGWGVWKASVLYKAIMANVFLNRKEIFESYNEAVDAIICYLKQVKVKEKNEEKSSKANLIVEALRIVEDLIEVMGLQTTESFGDNKKTIDSNNTDDDKEPSKSANSSVHGAYTICENIANEKPCKYLHPDSPDTEKCHYPKRKTEPELPKDQKRKPGRPAAKKQ